MANHQKSRRDVNFGSGVGDCWARTHSLFREYRLQRSKNMQASQTEEEMRQQQRTKTMTYMIRRIKARGRMDANTSWSVSELLFVDCNKTWHAAMV